MSRLVEIVTAHDPALRDTGLETAIASLAPGALLRECAALESFRRRADNLYERVRALFLLYAIHRFHLATVPGGAGAPAGARIPFEGHELLRQRRFDEAIRRFLDAREIEGAGPAIASALAAAYRGLGFQTLADQVRRSVRSVRGNQWMFRCGHPLDQPLTLRRELLGRGGRGAFPILRERTPVRMDLSHSAWSDIFFLGMDHPEGARVLNVSIDLGVRGRDRAPQPPVETFLRVIDEPLLRLTSIDLGATADVTELPVLFDFARDHLGLLKAAVLASGLVPPGIEGSGTRLSALLARLMGREGLGLEVVSHVRGIPKGSRLAVSTTLLASLVALGMRASGQTKRLEGALDEDERRTCAARAILGEWLGGSGGGWQDSGGLWPGVKLIEGVLAGPGDPEHGTSRGRLLPKHTLLEEAAVPASTREALQRSLVLVHGGMAQNVGPILEMVTEKYLLRSEREWQARQETGAIMTELLAALRSGDMAALGRATTRNFFGPIATIIPFATNHFTETVIERVKGRFGADFLGFWMLGGMSGGGMGFVFTPARDGARQDALLEILRSTKRELEQALPFAMDPIVYDFAINERGSVAELLGADRERDEGALLPPAYYGLVAPALLRADAGSLSRERRGELDRFGEACRTRPEFASMVGELFDRLLPKPPRPEADGASLAELLEQGGFDRELHEQVRADLIAGRIGLAQNRLPASTKVEGVSAGDVIDARDEPRPELRERGLAMLARGEAAVVTLAAGAASRWTQGAGTIKALHPFWKVAGRHRSFLDVHLAKTRRISLLCGTPPPHHAVVPSRGSFRHETRTVAGARATSTSHFERDARAGPDAEGDVRNSWRKDPRVSTAIGLRLVPMVRDLRFAWEETRQQVLDVQAQKVRESLQAALIAWAEQAGEGSDYTDNVPAQCVHPIGHWYEVPNLLRNGVLATMLREHPRLHTLMLHNVDTLGADLDPALLALHRDQVERGTTLTFEVIERQLDDRGGGLARVDGRLRLVEGLALPREELELDLGWYNTMTTWIDVDGLLRAFDLTRDDVLAASPTIPDAIRRLSARMPTYVTLKEVKKRWGHGHEDVFPVTQFEKLWSDMTALPELECRYVAVPRPRGQQLKEPAQLDGWLRDGSAEYVAERCEW